YRHNILNTGYLKYSLIPSGRNFVGLSCGIFRGMKRREFLSSIAAAPLAATVSTAFPITSSAQAPQAQRARTRIKQSVMASVWTGTNSSFEERCKILARIGFKGVDLPTAQQVPILKQNGLTPALMTGTGSSFQKGIIRKESHSQFEDETK